MWARFPLVRACVRACVCAWVRERVCACLRACVWIPSMTFYQTVEKWVNDICLLCSACRRHCFYLHSRSAPPNPVYYCHLVSNLFFYFVAHRTAWRTHVDVHYTSWIVSHGSEELVHWSSCESLSRSVLSWVQPPLIIAELELPEINFSVACKL